MTFRPGPFHLSLILFGFTSFWGTVTACDATVAGRRFLWIAGGILLSAILARLPDEADRGDRRVPTFALAVSGLTTGVATWFLLTHDWTQAVGKVAWLNPLQQLLARHPVSVPWPALHPNVAGGVLACLLPLHVAAVWPGGDDSLRRPHRSLASLGLVLVVLAVVMSRLRGGWLALAVSSASLAWWGVGKRFGEGRGAGRLFAIVTTLVAVTLGIVAILAVDGGLPRPDRWQLWTNSWFLAWDYPITGLGLGGFPMAYSSYALLVHVPYMMHAHNLFLDTWLEQGILGLVALLWLAWLGLSPSQPGSAARWATAARLSWLITLVLGLVDDVHFGYGGLGAWLLFLPLAAQSRRRPNASPALRAATVTPRRVRFGAAALAAAALVMTFVPGVRAAIAANRVALAQTQAELTVYHWPAWPVQDAVRRAPVVEIAPIIEGYQRALSLAPNASANMRLGQIEISLGQYESARVHLAAAFAATPQRPAVRQLFGETLAIAGDIAGAARLWRTLNVDVDQLAIREGWYRLLDEPQRAARVREAAALAAAR